MIRRAQTRAGQRQQFYHESESNGINFVSNDIIRPPTSHPYGGYKNKKSQSQMRTKYSPNFFLQSKLENNLRQIKSTFQSYACIDKLPQIYKLLINQIRVAFKNAVNSTNHEFDQLIVNLTKAITDLIQQKNYLIHVKQQNQKTIQTLNSRVFQLQKKIHRNDYTNQSKGNKKEGSSKIQQQIMLQNCRLGQLNTKYLARITQLQKRKIQKSVIAPSFKQNQNKCDTQLLRCQNRISYLQMKLTTAEKMENDLTIKNQNLSKQLEDTKQKLQNFEKDYKQKIQKMHQWRERALMQKQDGQIHISRQQFLLYSLKKLKQNNKNLLNKFLSAYKSDEKIQKKDFQQSPNFQYEIDIFKSIRTMYQKGKGQRLYTHGEIPKSQLGLDFEQVQINYQNYKRSDTFDVSNLRYFRPSFFSFLEQSINPQTIQSRNKCNNSVSRVFIQVLRSIMISKLNQFMLTQYAEKYTRFPQFTYAWFQKFYFNTQKNTVCTLEPFMQKPMNQETFYKDLMNIKLDQSWEIITFRQFIMEELSLQQLYFYLMCQMLLYSRAGITKQLQYQGDFCILVEYTAAKSVLDITLNDFQSWNITFLTSKLRQKITIKKNKEFIQAGFFLRCLLQYYRIERSNRFRYISKLCSEFKDKKGLRFSSFMSVINKFTQVATQTKLKLYRDCFCLTRGVITPQSIFIVCSEQMIFLKHLKMKSFYRIPKIISKPSKVSSVVHNQNQQSLASSKITKTKPLICLQPPDPYLYDIIIGFTNITNQQNNITKRIQTLGVGQFHYQINSLIRALDQRNTQLGSNVLKCKHFLHYFTNALQIVRKVTYYNLYQLLQQQTKKKSNNFWIQICDQDLGQIFAQQIKATFNTYNRINQLRKWKNKVYEFRINNAAKKIQREVKKKFIQPYMQIYNYFCNQVKQIKEDQRQSRR